MLWRADPTREIRNEMGVVDERSFWSRSEANQGVKQIFNFVNSIVFLNVLLVKKYIKVGMGLPAPFKQTTLPIPGALDANLNEERHSAGSDINPSAAWTVWVWRRATPDFFTGAMGLHAGIELIHS